VQQAADLGVAAPTMAAALDARYLSDIKDQRVAASKVCGREAGAVRHAVVKKGCSVSCVWAVQRVAQALGRALRGGALCTLASGACAPRPRAQVFGACVQPGPAPGIDKAQLVADVRKALYAAKICSYAQVGGGGRPSAAR
jgi:6-phosphogluconate dehydrogenase